MTYYWDKRFLKHLDIDNTKIVFEVGARFGDETLKLKTIFKNSNIYSFECNPDTVPICKKKLFNKDNIYFFDFALGEKEINKKFYSYYQGKGTEGASSFFKRIDFDKTQKDSGFIKMKRLDLFCRDNNIDKIDLLCMDVQGYELNILKGSNNFLKNINYIIMENPKDINSKYLNVPANTEIKSFMKNNNFSEVERLEENNIEDNVMYKNMLI